MDRASSLIFPGSRTLAGWWRQLAPHRPTALWVGYAFLHRVEAAVNVLRDLPVEPLHHLVLQALALEPTGETGVADLHARMRLPGPIVQRVLGGMQEAGLLTRSGAERWRTTERGDHALQTRHVPIQVQERRCFPFLECTDSSGQRLAPSRFLPIAECAGAPWQVDDAHCFDLTELQACIAQPAAWKNACGFPLDVQTLASDAKGTDWRHVVVDRPERVLLVLILTSVEGMSELLGFAVKVDGWTLYDRAPAVRLSLVSGAIWPEIAQSPPSTVWQEAWRSWCRQRQLPGNEVEICALNYQPPRLEVQAPGRFVQRLQAAKSDLFKGDTWLLVGDGYVRTAAHLTVKQSL